MDNSVPAIPVGYNQILFARANNTSATPSDTAAHCSRSVSATCCQNKCPIDCISIIDVLLTFTRSYFHLQGNIRPFPIYTDQYPPIFHFFKPCLQYFPHYARLISNKGPPALAGASRISRYRVFSLPRHHASSLLKSGTLVHRISFIGIFKLTVQ